MTDWTAVLSVDLEWFGHTPAYRAADGTTGQTDAGHEAVPFLLDAFNESDALGTFFVVSELVDSGKGILKQIADAGHEIGSHTRSHHLLTELTPAERREELSSSLSDLETVCDSVDGFRAPAFDIGPDHFDILHECGYTYDSSIVPARPIPGWYGGEFGVERPCPADAFRERAPPVMELPVSVMPGLRLPLTGAWVRFFGRQYTILGMRLLARRGITPVVYVHPWELVDLPEVDGVPRRVYWRTGEWMRETVRRILDEPFKFVRARTVAEGAT